MPSTSPPTTLIAGGGIAGLAAALRLAEAGHAVTLLETRKKLGGRATSFTDVRTGLTLDNCQHVALGCCTNYLDLLARLHAADQITWHTEQFWVEPGGRTSIIKPGLLPAPLHYCGAMLRATFLTFAEKNAIGRGSLAVLRARRADWVSRTFLDFLKTARQPQRAIDRFWAPVVVSACNLAVDRVAASSALHVFQEGFLASARAAHMGVPAVPLVDLYDRAESAITAAGGRGGTLRLGASVDRLTDTAVTLSTGETLTADHVICALPFERALEVVDPALRERDPRFADMARLHHSPILGVHLLYDAPVLPTPHAVLVDGQAQWLFRKDDAGKSIHAVISGADAWTDLPESEIATRIDREILAYFPAASAKLLAARPVKEKRATFAPTPDAEAHRPPATSPASPLILAGDYTATNWPATMEGATRSGYTAAAAVLGKPLTSLHAPELPATSLARLLSHEKLA